MADELRPRSWDEYVGQSDLKDDLEIRIQAAIVADRPLDPILLCGPPGAGKTSLAAIVASRLGDVFVDLTMPVTFKTLARLIQENRGIVLFLDEVHALKGRQEELLPLVEFGYLQDPNGRRIETDFVSIIGGTTERHKILPPLWDRFPVKPLYAEYSEEDMAHIVVGMGAKLDIELDDDMAAALGRAAAGVPRRARQFVLAYRDLVGASREPSLESVLKMCNVCSDGLTTDHVEYLRVLRLLGCTAGEAPLASLLRLHPTVLHEIERQLFNMKLIEPTGQGRSLTTEGLRRAPRTKQQNDDEPSGHRRAA